jgi:hypothetical protein
VSTKFIIRSPACVVDQDADTADFALDALDRRHDRGMIGDVDHEGGGRAAGGKANGLLAARGVEIEDGEPAALFREAKRDRPADAAAAAGNYGDLILQSAECHAARSAAYGQRTCLRNSGLRFSRKARTPSRDSSVS